MIRYMRGYLIICSEKLLQNLSILLLHDPQSAYPSCQAEFSASMTPTIGNILNAIFASFLLLGGVPLFQGRLPLMLFATTAAAGRMYRSINVLKYPIDRWIRYMKLINTYTS